MFEYYKVIDTNEISRMNLLTGEITTYNNEKKEWLKDFDKARMFIGELEAYVISEEQAKLLIN